MSGDRTTPRFDVIASTRRSWSVTQKQAIIGEIGVGDATLSDVARLTEVARHALRLDQELSQSDGEAKH